MNTDLLSDLRRNFMSCVFQNSLLLSNLNVEENILLGRAQTGESLNLSSLLELLQISELQHKFPHELSGGQRQRVCIARAVIKKPKLLFCDEATGSLDEANSKLVVELLHHLKMEYDITILFITHNLQIAKTADRIITLNNGLIISDAENINPISAQQMIWE